MNKNYDVIIVGAGPSGSIAGYELSKRGAKVLIIEKDKFPRYKTCGGTIQHKTLKYIPFDISKVIENTIYGVSFSHKFQNSFSRKYEKPLMYCISRENFDTYLLNKAKNQGAEVIEGQKVVNVKLLEDNVLVRTEDQEFNSKYVIGADGAYSIVAKSLNFVQVEQKSLGIESEIIINENITYNRKDYVKIDWGTLPSGYAWLFPKLNNLSVGVGGPIIIGSKLKSYFKKFLNYLNISEEQVKSLKAHILPTRTKKIKIYIDRALLVGDAAGLIDAFTGEGISLAIRSGQLAAKVLFDCLGKKTVNLSEYQRIIDAEIISELFSANLWQHIFNCFPNRFHNSMKTNDRLWSAFCRIVRGEKTFLSIKNELGPFKFLWYPIERITRYAEYKKLLSFRDKLEEM